MMHGTRRVYPYGQCSRCGSLTLLNLQDPPLPEDYYTQRPLPGNLGTAATSSLAESSAKQRDARGRRAWTRLRLAAPRWWWPFSGQRFDWFRWFTRTRVRIDSTILDAGCGSGRLAFRLAREGFEHVLGIDPHLPPSVDTRIDTNPRFQKCALEDYSGVHDLVMAHHSFEHCDDPMVAFEGLAAATKPGGWLLIRVPRADSWAFRRYRENWVQLDAPRHRFIPTTRAMERMAEATGLRLVHVRDDSGPFQVWGSEAFAKDRALFELGGDDRARRRAIGWWNRLRARFMSLWLRARREGDQAAFYFERPA